MWYFRPGTRGSQRAFSNYLINTYYTATTTEKKVLFRLVKNLLSAALSVSFVKSVHAPADAAKSNSKYLVFYLEFTAGPTYKVFKSFIKFYPDSLVTELHNALYVPKNSTQIFIATQNKHIFHHCQYHLQQSERQSVSIKSHPLLLYECLDPRPDSSPNKSIFPSSSQHYQLL